MSSKEWSGSDLHKRARDVADAVTAIHSYVKGMSRAKYLSDRKTQSAAERELLTVAEAVAKILEMDDTVEGRFPLVPWRSIRGMGNIRHEYESVDPAIVWNTITGDDLDALADAVGAL